MADHQSRVILSLIDKNFSSGLKSAIGAARNFGSSVKEHLNNAGTAATAAGGAITAFGMSSLKSFGDTQTQLNKAAITAGGTSKNIGELAAVANKMGKDLPLSAEDASKAMVGMAQNGANLKQLKDQFPAIAKASTAAGSDLGATADAVQQAYNIWGGSAQQNAAILVQTANASNASIETMKDAYANVGTNAHALGINLSTTSEAIGLLTNKGMTSARASMDLNHALTQMIRPSKAAQGEMDELGITYTDAHGKMKPFKEILQELNSAMADYTPVQKQAALSTMYGVAGEQAMLPLLEAVNDKTGNVSTSFDAYEKSMQKAAGTSKQAGKTLNKQANEMQKNVGSALEQVGGSWDDLKNSALQSQDGMMRKILNNISNVISHIQRGKDVFSKVVKGAIGLAPVLGPAILAVGLLMKGISQIGALVNPWTAVFAVIGILIAQFAAAYKSSKPLRDAVKSIGDAFKSVFGDQIKQLLGTVKDFFDTLDGKSKKTNGDAKKFGDQIAKFIKSINWKAIFQTISNVIYLIVSFIKSSGFQKFLQLTGNLIKQIVGFIGDMIKTFKESGMEAALGELIEGLTTLADGILAVFVKVLPIITGLIKGIAYVLGPVISLITATVGAIAEVIGELLQLVSTIDKPTTKALNSFGRWFKKTWNGLVRFLSNLWKSIRKTASKLWHGIMSAISYVISFNVKLIQNMFRGLGNALAGIWRGISKTASSIWKSISRSISNFVRAAGNDIRKIWNGLTSWIGKIWNGLLSLAKRIFKGIKYEITHPIQSGKNIINNLINDIKNIFKSLGNINLWNIGRKIIDGFLKGLKSKWDEGKNFFSNIGPWIAQHKGPIDYDAHLLTPAGEAIMTGLNRGLLTKYRDVQSTIAGITSDLANTAITMPADFNDKMDDISVRSRLSLQTDLQNQQIQIDRRPANINVTLGGHEYSTFVHDITNEQDRQYDLNRRR